jgi:hypothetical protein
MKYAIFAGEILLLILWLVFGPHNLLLKVVGVIAIIALSQLLHVVFKAR